MSKRSASSYNKPLENTWEKTAYARCPICQKPKSVDAERCRVCAGKRRVDK